ncbi:hypothetical protein RHECNPAF_12210029 [Rhizobium etli CNPAF512]|nr:hypothetical protein RHECNPAF_12210029 [Rhizobium etli CNPAF512]
MRHCSVPASRMRAEPMERNGPCQHKMIFFVIF